MIRCDNMEYRTILYVSKILFPKYPSYLFPSYMLRMYIKITAVNIYREAFTIPDKFCIKLLGRFKKTIPIDANNCLLVKENVIRALGIQNFAKIFIKSDTGNVTRIVQVVSLKDLALDSKYDLVGSSTLIHNLKTCGINNKFNLAPAKSLDLKTAKEVNISLINMAVDISAVITDEILKNYFKMPKIVYKNDVISINIKEFARGYFYSNMHVNETSTIYFKCNTIKVDENDDFPNGCVCTTDEACLKQSANVQNYIPRNSKILKLIDVKKLEEINTGLIDNCPLGLQDYFRELENSILPFLNKNCLLKVNPMFLVQGPEGCGKKLIVSALADKLGVHMYRISSLDVSASVYAQVESKLRTVFFKVKLVSPAIFVMDNFENFGKNNEGQYDQRIMHNFHKEIDNLFSSNNYPIIVVCISNKKDIHIDLKRRFLAVFNVEIPTQEQRLQMLKWLVELKNLEVEGELESIANKSYGFCYEDLEALIFYARSYSYGEAKDTSKMKLEETYLAKALEMMQYNYSQSIGAPKVPKVQWSDIGGLEDIKKEIVKTIELPLKHPEYFKSSGLKRSGILLYGPPGTGKTLIAKAVATECNLCFLSIKGPELLNMYVGQSEQNIRDVFERARQASPCIIFFDELDSLAPNRGMSGDSGGVMDRVVSQLLAEMDGLNQQGTLFIIGATNRPDLIDPALLRPGRFDKLLYVGPCVDIESKLSVLRALTRKFSVSDDVNLEEIVKICPDNITGADYYGLCSTAWMSAVGRVIAQVESGARTKETLKSQDVVVNMEDFTNAIKSVKPSVRSEDLRYFEKLKQEFSVNS